MSLLLVRQHRKWVQDPDVQAKARATQQPVQVEVFTGTRTAPPAGVWGWEVSAIPEKLGATRPEQQDVLPSVLSGAGGWDPALPPPRPRQSLAASLVDVLPAALSGRWGFEAVLPPPRPRLGLPPHLADVLPAALSDRWGFEAVLPGRQGRHGSSSFVGDIFPGTGISIGMWGWDLTLPLPGFRLGLPPHLVDVLPAALSVC